MDFAADSCLNFVKQYPNVVVSRTLSKSYSLAGLRLGFAFANPALIWEMLKVKDSYNLDMMTQAVGAAALRDRDYMLANCQRLRVTRDRLGTDLAGLGFHTLPSQTNFILTRPPMDAERVFLALRERGFLVRYFRDPRIADRIRVTIGTDAEMTGFVAAVRAILAEAKA